MKENIGEWVSYGLLFLSCIYIVIFPPYFFDVTVIVTFSIWLFLFLFTILEQINELKKTL